MSDYVVRAQAFVKEIYPYIKGLRANESVNRAIYKFNQEHHRHVIFAHGAARRAFITSDYVIKMNYGTGHQWAGGCEHEYKIYTEEFSKSKFSYLFAPIHKFTYNGKDFYIMPRVNGIGTGKYWNNLTQDERWYINDHVNDMHRGNYGHYKRKPVIVDYAMIRPY